jgi:hypothetical protein
MTIALYYSDIALVSSVMIWCTTVATVPLLEELGDCTDRPVFWISFVEDTAALSALFVVAGVVYLDAVQLPRAAVVMWT